MSVSIQYRTTRETSRKALPVGTPTSMSRSDALAAEFASRNVGFSEPLKDTGDGLRGFEVKDADARWNDLSTTSDSGSCARSASGEVPRGGRSPGRARRVPECQ